MMLFSCVTDIPKRAQSFWIRKPGLRGLRETKRREAKKGIFFSIHKTGKNACSGPLKETILDLHVTDTLILCETPGGR